VTTKPDGSFERRSVRIVAVVFPEVHGAARISFAPALGGNIDQRSVEQHDQQAFGLPGCGGLQGHIEDVDVV
jgi:hypothetical protein